MSCCVIAALPPIARQQGAPRITAPHVPIGSNAGEPNNIPMQTAILKESLEWVRDCPSYNGLKVLPMNTATMCITARNKKYNMLNVACAKMIV